MISSLRQNSECSSCLAYPLHLGPANMDFNSTIAAVGATRSPSASVLRGTFLNGHLQSSTFERLLKQAAQVRDVALTALSAKTQSRSAHNITGMADDIATMEDDPKNFFRIQK